MGWLLRLAGILGMNKLMALKIAVLSRLQINSRVINMGKVKGV